MQIECKVCHTFREIKYPKRFHKEGQSTCTECAIEARKGDFWRVCEECGDRKKVMTKNLTKAKLCKKCSAKKLGKAMAENNRIYPKGTWKPKTYTVVCPTCHETREITRNPKFNKTNNCITCAKTLSGLARRGKVRKKPEFKIKKVAEPKLCKKKKVVAKKIKKINHTQRKVSKEAIEKQIKINREHKKAVQEQKSIPKPKLTEEEMIQQFLKHHKPSVLADTSPIEHITPSSGLCL